MKTFSDFKKYGNNIVQANGTYGIFTKNSESWKETWKTHNETR
jgi:hypothetical protein